MDEVGVRRHVVLHVERPLRVASMACLPNPSGTPSARSPRLMTAAGQAYVPRYGTRDVPMRRTVEREQREPHKRRRGRQHSPAEGAQSPVSWQGERRSSRKRAGRLRYDPQCGGDPSGVMREPAVPFTWTGIEDRSSRACAGVGSGLVPQCLQHPPVGSLCEVTRNPENPMRTIASMLCTGDGAGLALPNCVEECDAARVEFAATRECIELWNANWTMYTLVLTQPTRSARCS